SPNGRDRRTDPRRRTARADGPRGAAMTLRAMLSPLEQRRARIRERLERWQHLTEEPVRLVAEGRLVRMVGMPLDAVGCDVPVGGRGRIVGRGHEPVDAEAV